MKSHMTIGTKLMMCFGASVAVTLILGFTSVRSIGKLNAGLANAVNTTARSLQNTGQISTASSDMLAGQRGLIVYAYSKSSAGVNRAGAIFESAAARYEKALQEIRPLITNEEGRRIWGELDGQLSSWRSFGAEIRQAADAFNAEVALRVANEKGLPVYEANTRSVSRLTELQNQSLADERARGESQGSASRWTALAIVALSLGVGVLTFFALRQTSRALQRAAAELSESSEQVASAANQVSASSQALAQGASEQAATIEETSASSEEITSMTRKNAENSRSAADEMVESSRLVAEANNTLQQMVASMREINTSSDKIGKIIKVIDEIAFQTNILALNAAVEAARAGEAGMGFAVVADEVRNLAQRSAQAAKDTATLIEESIAKSTEGSSKLDQVTAAIRAITDSAQRVKMLVDEVKLGSEEQARGIEQIAKAITQMETVTQKAAANAEESASAGEEMSAQAENLNGIVEGLREMVGGGAELRQAGRAAGPTKAKAADAAPRRERAHAAGMAALQALHAAVKHKTAPVEKPLLAGVARDRSAIPLDEDFKEF